MTVEADAIAELWRFPVKSMQGERVEEVTLTERGIVGDRVYAVIDSETGKVASAKSVRLFPGLLACRASFVEPPQEGNLPPVQINLPDGRSVTSDSGDLDRMLSAYFRREVSLAQVAPEDFTIDQYFPDIVDADPGGNRDVTVEQKLGSALFASLGEESPVPVGSFFDVFPLSVMTTSTLAHLSELSPQSRFEQRRFRMNVIVRTEQSGFVENAWVNQRFTLGEAQIRVTMLDPRCVMTTLEQEDLPQDTDVLRTLVAHNRMQVGDFGRLPCAGVYAVVVGPGSVRIGDEVELI